ncbi:MAG: diphthine--ammonia ligase [Candidatus Omnitrophica bacterium]|nr:diphthine--ammonia ligase [Candidatus Omnitrophota bacterium]
MSDTDIKAFVSWSGGKESSFALHQAISKGFQIFYLLNMVTEDGERSRSHGLNSKLIQAQSEALNIPLLQQRCTWETYEEEFKKAVLKLKEKGVKAGVFGDIDLQEHRDWVERVCREVKTKAYLPLWGKNQKELLEEFILARFEAIIVAIRAEVLDKDWLGKKIDKNFIQELEKKRINLCGESGEYHTFVINGPIFKRRIKILESDKVLKNGHWFLNVLKYEFD